MLAAQLPKPYSEPVLPSGDRVRGWPHSVPRSSVSIVGTLSPTCAPSFHVTGYAWPAYTIHKKSARDLCSLRRDQICLVYLRESNKFSFSGKLNVGVPEVPLLLHMNKESTGFCVVVVFLEWNACVILHRKSISISLDSQKGTAKSEEPRFLGLTHHRELCSPNRGLHVMVP